MAPTKHTLKEKACSKCKTLKMPHFAQHYFSKHSDTKFAQHTIYQIKKQLEFPPQKYAQIYDVVEAVVATGRTYTANNVQRCLFTLRNKKHDQPSEYQFKQIQLLEERPFCYQIGKRDDVGYFLFATQDVKAGTVLCEYCGELNYLLETHDEVLSYGNISNQNKEIGIITDKYCNEGRFILGVSPYWKERANCELRFFKVGNVCRSFVLTTKDVFKNQIFYAYYGEEYDTVAKNFSFIENYDTPQDQKSFCQQLSNKEVPKSPDFTPIKSEIPSLVYNSANQIQNLANQTQLKNAKLQHQIISSGIPNVFISGKSKKRFFMKHESILNAKIKAPLSFFGRNFWKSYELEHQTEPKIENNPHYQKKR